MREYNKYGKNKKKSIMLLAKRIKISWMSSDYMRGKCETVMGWPHGLIFGRKKNKKTLQKLDY
jgi:hypothetical protein